MLSSLFLALGSITGETTFIKTLLWRASIVSGLAERRRLREKVAKESKKVVFDIDFVGKDKMGDGNMGQGSAFSSPRGFVSGTPSANFNLGAKDPMKKTLGDSVDLYGMDSHMATPKPTKTGKDSKKSNPILDDEDVSETDRDLSYIIDYADSADLSPSIFGAEVSPLTFLNVGIAGAAFYTTMLKYKYRQFI
mgnify:CR=1 FL=1